MKHEDMIKQAFKEATTLKTCSCCKEKLPLTMFGKLKASKDGYNYLCKPCIKERNKKAIKRTTIKQDLQHLYDVLGSPEQLNPHLGNLRYFDKPINK